jgi:hypothetical protein
MPGSEALPSAPRSTPEAVIKASAVPELSCHSCRLPDCEAAALTISGLSVAACAATVNSEPEFA